VIRLAVELFSIPPEHSITTFPRNILPQRVKIDAYERIPLWEGNVLWLLLNFDEIFYKELGIAKKSLSGIVLGFLVAV
jgi:hypothetical protein